MAEFVAGVCKTLAFLLLVGGVIAAVATGYALHYNSTLSSASIVGTSVGIAVGGIVAASTVAFFGYVLDLLMEIRDRVVKEWR
jgi:hypothetical protein